MTNTTGQGAMLSRVTDFIQANLLEDLSLQRLSEVALISKYHFHRQFFAAVGVNVFQYIQLMRFKRASYLLAYHHQLKIIDIALSVGFESHEGFARAFKKHIGQSPSAFRTAPDWEKWHKLYQFSLPRSKQTMQVDIIEFPETKVAVLEHRGTPTNLNHSIASFITWRKTSGLSPVQTCQTFGVAFDDPNNCIPEDFRFDICGSVTKEVPENEFGVRNKIIPAGRCAHFKHIGPHEDMNPKIYQLYQSWLPNSGETLRDFPLIFEYKNFFPEVAESDLITEVYVPIS